MVTTSCGSLAIDSQYKQCLKFKGEEERGAGRKKRTHQSSGRCFLTGVEAITGFRITNAALSGIVTND